MVLRIEYRLLGLVGFVLGGNWFSVACCQEIVRQTERRFTIEYDDQSLLFKSLGLSYSIRVKADGKWEEMRAPRSFYTTPKIPRARLYYRTRELSSEYLPNSLRPASCSSCSCDTVSMPCHLTYIGRFGGCLNLNGTVDYCLRIRDTSGWCKSIINQPLKLPQRADPIALKGNEQKLLEIRLQKKPHLIGLSQKWFAQPEQLAHLMADYGLVLPPADSALSDPHEPVLDAWRIAQFVFGVVYREQIPCVVFNLFVTQGGTKLEAVHVVYSPHAYYSLRALETVLWSKDRLNIKPISPKGFITCLVMFDNIQTN